MSKVPVAAAISHRFSMDCDNTNPDFTGDIKWNFEKFLLDENGKLIHRFRSKVTPDDAALIAAINM
ncbi:MAG: hypothetical protein U0X76_09285 [Bacteroidia bacterium]